MWVSESAPERIAELFQNYEHALQVFGPKGSESSSGNESTQAENDRMTGVKPREHFAQPGEAEWGC
jgi:hypothetical protein